MEKGMKLTVLIETSSMDALTKYLLWQADAVDNYFDGS